MDVDRGTIRRERWMGLIVSYCWWVTVGRWWQHVVVSGCGGLDGGGRWFMVYGWWWKMVYGGLDSKYICVKTFYVLKAYF
ncbi:hypothetical protein HanPSC8_Chr03g0107501 [Helianthus annuus]|nr:hypothetical protein HanPSC8_Chr03g0107501 [Helianthus annuus]